MKKKGKYEDYEPYEKLLIWTQFIMSPILSALTGYGMYSFYILGGHGIVYSHIMGYLTTGMMMYIYRGVNMEKWN